MRDDQRQTQRTDEARTEAEPARRPYEKPAFVTRVVFERAALSCGQLNVSPGPPPFGCSLQS